jgi:hypothetical protein
MGIPLGSEAVGVGEERERMMVVNMIELYYVHYENRIMNPITII